MGYVIICDELSSTKINLQVRKNFICQGQTELYLEWNFTVVDVDEGLFDNVELLMKRVLLW
jgi:hypothetical protein